MSEQGVKLLMGRLVADEKFRTSFFRDPGKSITYAGYNLDQTELTAVTRLKPTDLQVKLNRAGIGPQATFEIDVRSAKF